MTPTRPEAFVFDVNQTLFDFAAWIPALEGAGLKEDALSLLFARTLRDGFALAAADDFAAFDTLLHHHLSAMLPGDEEERTQSADSLLQSLSSLPAHRDVRPALERLRTEGLMVATLTNGSRSLTRKLLAANDLEDLVARTFDVAEARVWKPRAEAYRHAARALEIPLQKTAMIAVHPWDLHGASRVGMMTGWVDRDGVGYPEAMASPAVRGSSLTEVVEGLLAMDPAPKGASGSPSSMG